MCCRMANYPRWRGLKHFLTVTNIQFTDAQQFFDILKVSLFASCSQLGHCLLSYSQACRALCMPLRKTMFLSTVSALIKNTASWLD
jgi:hypothetical protein